MRAQRADELYELKNTDIFYDTSKTNFEERELHEYVRMLKKKKERKCFETLLLSLIHKNTTRAATTNLTLSSP